MYTSRYEKKDEERNKAKTQFKATVGICKQVADNDKLKRIHPTAKRLCCLALYMDEQFDAIINLDAAYKDPESNEFAFVSGTAHFHKKDDVSRAEKLINYKRLSNVDFEYRLLVCDFHLAQFYFCAPEENFRECECILRQVKNDLANLAKTRNTSTSLHTLHTLREDFLVSDKEAKRLDVDFLLAKSVFNQKQDMRGAKELFDALLKESKKLSEERSVECRYYKLVCELKLALGEKKAAESDFKRISDDLAKTVDSSRRYYAHAQFYAGICFFHISKYEEALQAFKFADNLKRDFEANMPLADKVKCTQELNVYLMKSMFYLAIKNKIRGERAGLIGKFAETIEKCDKFIENSEQKGTAVYYKAWSLYFTGKYEEVNTLNVTHEFARLSVEHKADLDFVLGVSRIKALSDKQG